MHTATTTLLSEALDTFATLFDEELAKLAWQARITPSDSIALPLLQKVCGELYSAVQKIVEQLRQLIAVGCYRSMVDHFSVKETAVGSNPTNKSKMQRARRKAIIKEKQVGIL